PSVPHSYAYVRPPHTHPPSFPTRRSSDLKPGGKRPAIGLQIKLPCTSMADVKSRYGAELRQARFFIRTRSLRPADTLVRLEAQLDRKSTRLNSSHLVISYAVFCLKKKKTM